MAPTAQRSRLKSRYEEEIRPALVERFQYTTPMQAPVIRKITLNMGVGDAKQDSKVLEAATEQLATIAGQRPSVRRARKSIAAFKLREGMPVGVSVTLRGERSYEFLDRLMSVAIPRIRDFRGLNPRSFDGRGNYSLGVREQIIFPEIDYDAIDQTRGLDITITTSARTDAEAYALLEAFGFPFARPEAPAAPASAPAAPVAEIESPATEDEPEAALEGSGPADEAPEAEAEPLSGVGEAGATESETAEPEAAELEAAELETAEEETTEPEAAEPEATESETAEPNATEPEDAEPETAEPAAVEPEAAEPEATAEDATAAAEPSAATEASGEPEAGAAGTEPAVEEPVASGEQDLGDGETPSAEEPAGDADEPKDQE